MATITGPRLRNMTVDESRALLMSKHIGRMAFTLHDRVDIEPITYASDGDWIFGCTSPGTKLTTLLHNPWCAFETDEVHDLFDWSSVVAKGTFYLLDPEIASPDTYRRAERLLKAQVPEMFSTHGPAPSRDVLFGVFVHEISGRLAQR